MGIRGVLLVSAIWKSLKHGRNYLKQALVYQFSAQEYKLTTVNSSEPRKLGLMLDTWRYQGLHYNRHYN
ncbi:hypothetical protein KSX_74790 [Ktedonospora formicarum]|uniref:Uncharacterized protein n=1 Tax=Ktedonospora formicarum TaxID=2778364 RepID=A0A8J3MWT5_9CHLR|nr:hypothetical protein KSX_74790 [Ktedonospora formicarum]